MERIKSDGSQDGYFVDAIATGEKITRPGTVITAKWLNSVQDEIINIIKLVPQKPISGHTKQAAESISELFNQERKRVNSALLSKANADSVQKLQEEYNKVVPTLAEKDQLALTEAKISERILAVLSEIEDYKKSSSIQIVDLKNNILSLKKNQHQLSETLKALDSRVGEIERKLEGWKPPRPAPKVRKGRETTHLGGNSAPEL